jgi:hypothetical protein
MARNGCLLLQMTDGWKISALGSSSGDEQILKTDDPKSLADELVKFISGAKLSDQRLMIATDSQSTLTGRFATPPGHRKNRRMLSYELEDWLPWAAEDIVSDYVAAGNELFGAAIRLDAFLPFVTEIERRGMRIQSISPKLMLALQSLGKEVDLKSHDVLMWQEGSSCDLVCLAQGHIRKWQHVRSEDTAIRHYLAVEILESGASLRVAIVNGSAAMQTRLTEFEEVRLEPISTEALIDHVHRASETVLAGSESPWIEFRRDLLAGGDRIRTVRTELSWLTAAAAALLIAIALASWSRAVQNDQQILQLRARQESLFRESIPASQIPAGIFSRLRSEHTKLLGAHASGDQIDLPVPALNVLFEFLDGLPAAQSWQFPEIDIENGQLRIDAELPSHASANTLVAALRKHGFQIDSPTTNQIGDALVETRIYGRFNLSGKQRELER